MPWSLVPPKLKRQRGAGGKGAELGVLTRTCFRERLPEMKKTRADACHGNNDGLDDERTWDTVVATRNRWVKARNRKGALFTNQFQKVSKQLRSGSGAEAR